MGDHWKTLLRNAVRTCEEIMIIINDAEKRLLSLLLKEKHIYKSLQKRK